MKKKLSGSLALGKHRVKNVKHISDNKINFLDIPESTDKELKNARRVGRPYTGNAKQLIALRIAPKLLVKLKKIASKKDVPYQTLMHNLLENAVEKIAA